MDEVVQLQKQLLGVMTDMRQLREKVEKLEKSVEKDVIEMRREAKNVLEKASALINPYSTHTQTYDK